MGPGRGHDDLDDFVVKLDVSDKALDNSLFLNTADGILDRYGDRILQWMEGAGGLDKELSTVQDSLVAGYTGADFFVPDRGCGLEAESKGRDFRFELTGVN